MTDERSGAGGGMQIDADLVRQLAELLNDNGLTEIEVEDGGRRIAVKRQASAVATYAAAPPPQQPAAAPSAPAAAPVETAPADNPAAVKSPMVGTVYLSGEPGAPPFAAAGTQVAEGDTLVIIEAMKVMNPIAAPRAGTVRQVLVQDGQPVEFDQPLVIVE